MKSVIRRHAASLLALTLLLSAGFTLPVMADDDQIQPAADQTQTEQSAQTDAPADQPGQTEKTENTAAETAPKPLTAAQKEAQAIKKYGKYKGRNATKIPVITYHNVVTDRQKRTRQYRNDDTVISRTKFEQQMRWLKKNGYRTISCEEFYLWYKGRIRLPKKSVLITLDDGCFGVPENAYPILKKYKLKATCFVIGSWTLHSKSGYMTYKQMKRIQKDYPDLEFQSHTYNLHYKFSFRKGVYSRVLKDAKAQKKAYGFEYLAYPYGRNNNEMVRAYKKAGVKMAFAYRQYGNGYATRKQNIYRIKRIKIPGDYSMAKFRSVFRY